MVEPLACCVACGRPVVDGSECDACVDERVADEHERAFDACDCETCRSVRGRYASAARRREALMLVSGGGFSTFGREGLGWQEGDW